MTAAAQLLSYRQPTVSPQKWCYDFTVSMCLRLLSAWYTLFPFLLCGCRAPEYTDTCFSSPFLLVTLMDAMRSLDVSASHDFYYMHMSHGDPPRLLFVMLTISRLCFFFLLISGYVDSSFSWTSLRPVFYPPFRLTYTYLTGRYLCLVLF